MPTTSFDKDSIKASIIGKLQRYNGRTIEEASNGQIYRALASTVRDQIMQKWMISREERKTNNNKRLFYLSVEFLMGRSLYTNILNLVSLDAYKQALDELHIDVDKVLQEEPEPALGNGGLGRLAACFMDSLASLDLPAMGCSIRYEYGLFRQKIVDGQQVELPDYWLGNGNVWEMPVMEDACEVHFNGHVEMGNENGRTVFRHVGYNTVEAVPYDMPIIGYGAKNIGTLRLWQTESLHEIDFTAFNNQHYAQASADKNKAEDITKFLYPNDDRREGKQMRIKQQYVLVSASLQDMLRAYKKRHGDDYAWFAEEHAVQLNDTHPVMAIPELTRLLMEDGFTFDAAFEIVRNVFAYTNHTVMQEALEKWDLALLASVCPELVAIIRKIDAKFKADMAARGAEVKATRCIIWNNQVHMAQLAVYATVATNGVAAIHTEILKDDVFADWYALYPERFQNKTNGITQRRWLGLCNPELTALIEKHIGSGFLTDLDKLEALKPQISDDLCREFIAVKKEKKAQLAAEIEKREGVKLDPNMIFDIQVKRLHEYKRQLMNTMSILHLYFCLKDGTLTDFTPTAFIFGAKAAPGYARAKAIIHLTNMVADMVNNDPDTSSLLKVVFVHNYNCSWAEKLIPAADVSEQISTAGTEASGTGNMKLMLNGAVTLGTYDGANVEITEQAGRENEYIFGATVEEINALKKNGYDPRAIYKADKEIARVLDTMVDGTFPDPDGAIKELVSSLLLGASWHKPDHYFILHDFHSYVDAKLAVNRDYRDELSFARKCLMNIASAGMFSSDRTIAQYAKEIWKV